jgi:hypothetical protein
LLSYKTRLLRNRCQIAARVMSSRLCKKLEGAFFPFHVESLEDGVDDAVDAGHIHEADHGPGSSSHFHEAALDHVGGSHFLPQVPGQRRRTIATRADRAPDAAPWNRTPAASAPGSGERRLAPGAGFRPDIARAPERNIGAILRRCELLGPREGEEIPGSSAARQKSAQANTDCGKRRGLAKVLIEPRRRRNEARSVAAARLPAKPERDQQPDRPECPSSTSCPSAELAPRQSRWRRSAARRPRCAHTFRSLPLECVREVCRLTGATNCARPGDSRKCADYADIGIIASMPTPRLCRVWPGTPLPPFICGYVPPPLDTQSNSA